MFTVVGAFDWYFTALREKGHNNFWCYDTLTTLLQKAQCWAIRFTGAGTVPCPWKSVFVSCIRAA
jgi:hypothetical protein